MTITKVEATDQRTTYRVDRGIAYYTLRLTALGEHAMTLSFDDDSFWETFPVPAVKYPMGIEQIGGEATVKLFMDRLVPKYRTLHNRLARLPKKDMTSLDTFQNVPRKDRFRLKIQAGIRVIGFSMPSITTTEITAQPISPVNREQKGLPRDHPGIDDSEWLELISLLDLCRTQVEEIPEEQFERIVALIGSVPVKSR